MGNRVYFAYNLLRFWSKPEDNFLNAISPFLSSLLFAADPYQSRDKLELYLPDFNGKVVSDKDADYEADIPKEKHMKYEEIKCPEISKLHPDVTKEVHFVTPIQPPLFPFPSKCSDMFQPNQENRLVIKNSFWAVPSPSYHMPQDNISMKVLPLAPSILISNHKEHTPDILFSPNLLRINSCDVILFVIIKFLHQTSLVVESV